MGAAMRLEKVPKDEVFQRLTDVFRKRGYDGASYADLMKATGLVKASLYHRFPHGKEEMVDAILKRVDRQFAEYVLAPAFEKGDPRRRAQQVAKRIEEFYDGGKQWCLLDTLTLAESPSTLHHARKSMEFWTETLAKVSREAGIGYASARKRAEEVVAAIEGGLVVARVSGNRRPFLRILAALPARLTE